MKRLNLYSAELPVCEIYNVVCLFANTHLIWCFNGERIGFYAPICETCYGDNTAVDRAGDMDIARFHRFGDEDREKDGESGNKNDNQMCKSQMW